MANLVKVGKMPGMVNEYTVQVGTSIKDLLAMANMDASGYEIKVDDVTVNDISGTVVTEGTKLVLLVKMVKGA